MFLVYIKIRQVESINVRLYDKDTSNEIAVEVVLYLDPDVLEKEGGAFSCDPAFRVRCQRFFVCASVNGVTSRWLPLYTNPGNGRTLLDSTIKKGYPEWQLGQHYWHEAQVFEVGATIYFLPVECMTNYAKVLATALPLPVCQMSNISLQRLRVTDACKLEYVISNTIT